RGCCRPAYPRAAARASRGGLRVSAGGDPPMLRDRRASRGRRKEYANGGKWGTQAWAYCPGCHNLGDVLPPRSSLRVFAAPRGGAGLPWGGPAGGLMALLQISETGQAPDPHQRRIAVG